MDWRVAIKPSREGVVLDVEVVPGARESRFPAGFNPWRGRLEAKVRAPPQDGEANAELCALVATALGVAPSAVRVASGRTSRRKGVAVGGLSAEEVARRLAASLG